ncbi:uncharacterized protein LOC116292098 [Actinia tenebrosa]|uniref:Uncharacterized protein LOC116292098 n=1 Tax=Actinia tenebrosa TaxID=6105 RepID=A0A6P8HH83_ACTTE|nr:uncharacterized protein LOC116292098 [Actinia tenebrosa]
MITGFLTFVVLGLWMVRPVNTSESKVIGVSISCFPTHIEISLLRESFPGVNMSVLYLRSSSCQPSTNSSHVTFKAPLYGCQTRLVNIGGYYAFDNVVQGVSPSIKVTCVYETKPSGDSEEWSDSIKMTAQLSLYRDSKVSLPLSPGEVVRFELQKPQDLFFDLQIIPNQNELRVCLFVKFCGLFVEDEVLSLIENGQENKMTTRMLFTSNQRIIFRVNASFLVTSINPNTRLRALCTVIGYHENRTQETKTSNVIKDCSGNHDDKRHGNASDCQESKEELDSKEPGRNSTDCSCEQKGTLEDNQTKASCNESCANNVTLKGTIEVNQTKASCNESCVNNVTSPFSRDGKLRRKREVEDEGFPGTVSRENNNTIQSSFGNNGNNSLETVFNDTFSEKHVCSSPDWNGKPVSLLVEKEWTAKPSVPKVDLKWFEKDDARHVPKNITNDVNTTVVALAVESTEGRIPSAALLLAFSYLSLLLVIGPVLLVYMWDRRNQKKRRRYKQHTRIARGCSQARLLLTREQSVA